MNAQHRCGERRVVELTVSEGEVNAEQAGNGQNIEGPLERRVNGVLRRNVRSARQSNFVENVQTTDDEG